MTSSILPSVLTGLSATISAAVLLHGNSKEKQRLLVIILPRVYMWKLSAILVHGTLIWVAATAATALKCPEGKKESWLDSVTFHYCHACLPKIGEDASVNTVGVHGMNVSRSLGLRGLQVSS